MKKWGQWVIMSDSMPIEDVFFACHLWYMLGSFFSNIQAAFFH